MDTPKIYQRSPILVDETTGDKVVCTCGHSAKQPYCDGAHKTTTMRPMRITIEEDRKVAYCGCKHSANMPFCDGSHKRLPQE